MFGDGQRDRQTVRERQTERERQRDKERESLNQLQFNQVNAGNVGRTEDRSDSVTVFVHSRAQLEADEVFDVVINSFSFLDGRPGGRERATLETLWFKVVTSTTW